MAAQLSFEEFDKKLRHGELTPSEYKRYLEVDRAADPVHVRFKPGALRDEPPSGYDVDREVYRTHHEEQEHELESLLLTDLPRVTADGDSWFNLPPFICPRAIGNQLKADKKRLVVENVARWGDTIATIAREKRYIPSIRKLKPTWFLLSGGGNDLQQALEDGQLLEPYDPSRPIDRCISDSGHRVLQSVGATLRSILDEVVQLQPSIKILCYAYDFPRPALDGGEYLGQYLRDQRYPENTWDAIAHLFIDTLTNIVQTAIARVPNAQFLDCRRVTAKFDWWNDMHPETEGFGALMRTYEHAMGVALMARVPALRRAAKSKPKKSRRKRTVTRKATPKRPPARKEKRGKTRRRDRSGRS